ncbi:MAG: dTDP-4-dehydrorhamnose reductase [Okeania sp. SIO3B5]|uniref:dTDP-4-dehydrorhamnose reductase n=1 Tax=Okeania sp. SIO3B5 TaxID=2607811 RepID=UPI0013FE6241|nr:dTDP-4-dehydrorhamnose reductase [Okeania sp. SIO3B5]NEO56391.1 dTDP-4-dehydrorhamnose reductase [Okeania sp. SIO3B5]
MKILLTGINGQLGHQLQPLLTNIGEVTAVGRENLDLADSNAISQIISQVKPEIIVNAAAYTAVDKSENEPELANAVNSIAPGIMATEAKKLGATLIHISTDYVFDGSQSTPYTETNPTKPLGIYGKSKLEGEKAIRETEANHIIIRTAWVYGVYGKGNFVKTMLRVGKDREELRVVYDQVGCPTWTGDLAEAIAQIIPQLNSEIYGTYHYTNSGAISWYDFAMTIFEEAKQLGFPLEVKRVVPITTAEYPTPAKRPAFSVLNSGKISKVLGKHSPYWRDGLRQMLKQLAALSN